MKPLKQKLLPCPFCGGEFPYLNKALRNGYKKDEYEAFAYFIVCHACASQGGWAKSEGSAQRNWNMRDK